MKEKIRFLFYPESIAVIGASTNVAKWGFIILDNIIAGGYKGRVYPVNPRADSIFGLKCYRRVQDIPDEVHLAVITIPRDSVFDVLKDCADKGVKSIMVISSGFSEAGKEFVELENKLAEFGKEKGIPIAGPNGQGIFNAFINLSATMSYFNVKPAKISFVSQSGNMGNTMIQWAKKYGMGFGKFVSSGNEAMLKTEDYYEYFENDPDTDVVLSYVEGIDDGRKFFERLRSLASKKPVIVLKGAKTAEGRRAAESHTGAVAGSYEVFKSAVKQAGGILVENPEEMGDLAFAFLYQPLPKGKRVGAISGGGGWAVLVADALAEEGLELAKFSPSLMEELNKLLPYYWSRNNPVDLVAERKEGLYQRVAELVISEPYVDIFMALGIGYGYSGVFKIDGSKLIDPEMKEQIKSYVRERGIGESLALIELKEKFKKPIIAASDSMFAEDFYRNESLKILIENGIFVYPTPQRAARVAARMYWYAEYLRRRNGRFKE